MLNGCHASVLGYFLAAQTLTNRLAKIHVCPKLIDCGVVYRQLYEQPTVDLMNDNSHLFYVISFYTDKTMIWENEIYVKIKSATAGGASATLATQHRQRTE